MSENYINKFRKNGVDYLIKAASADTVVSATTSTKSESANSIGNVEKYSIVDTKPREGLKFKNNGVEAVIDLNYKSKDGTGNLEIESKNGHVNIESSKGIQIKPSTTVIFDSSRRIEANKGNEINFEAKFDDYKDRTNSEYNGKDGYDEEWAELKIKSRNLDLRCHDHGGIALQIAGKDSHGNENKIKFESDRTSSLSEQGTYNGEGGKGLEFGTFNNEHASLYCGDYRFKGNAKVYGVTREIEHTTDKTDYKTQDDDFKDIIVSASTNPNDITQNATWNEIIDAANKCKGKEAIASENFVSAQIAAAQLSGISVDLSAYATTEYVDNAIASSGGGSALQPGNGISISDGYISVNNYSNIEPLTALTENADALGYVKIGKSKGNFAVDVTGKYTWEETGPKLATTVDEYNNVVVKGDRVIKYSNETFYTNENKVYYKAGMETKLADGVTTVPADTIVYNSACSLTFDENCGYQHFELGEGEASYYEDPTKFAFKAKVKNAPLYSGATYPQFSGATTVPNKTMLPGSAMTEDEVAYYESLGAQYDEEGNEIVAATWERVDIWKKSTLWSINEININLETDSKIKFAGKKIETVWTYEENGEDVDHKMAEILLSTESLAADANEVVFEQKISKNGDRSGQDTEIVYTFGNNVADTEKVADFNAFKANYNGKHTPKTDEELQAMYDAFLAEGESYEIRVKASELLGLVARVTTLENTIADLTSRIEALESGE